MHIDCHTHSRFSPDADPAAEVTLMAERAEALGLDFITLTDHCDCCYWLPEGEGSYEEYQKEDSMMFGCRDYASASISEALSLKARHKNLLCGVELGEPLENTAAADEILGIDGLDFVIGSLHMNPGKPDFYFLQYDKMAGSEVAALLDDYFAQLLKLCEWGGFDSLAHLTYPLRYIEGECGVGVDLARYDDTVTQIFKTLIESGKALELNTSGYRQEYGKPFPDERFLKMYRSLGGELVTIGSDAHKVADIGAGIKQGEELLRECGFKYITLFKERKASPFIIG